MSDFVTEQVHADLYEYSLALSQKYGVRPVYFTNKNLLDPRECFDDIIYLSRYFWTCFVFTGLLTPWHDDPDPIGLLRKSVDYVRRWLWICEDMDVDWRSYCVLSFCMTPYEMYERPTMLLGQRKHWTWMRKFRKYTKSRKLVDEVAFFMLEFIRLQIEHSGRASFSKRVFIGPDLSRGVEKGKAPPKTLVLYQQVANRINQIHNEGVDYLDWLVLKCRNLYKMAPEQPLQIQTVVNVNQLDPDFDLLRIRAADEWRAVREFLGLSFECEFPDGAIPKGWQPASDDMIDRSKIRRITADGYYYYADGTQRRGKRHYATNKYLTIRVSPENFEEFHKEWDDPRLLTAMPTWEEYSRYGMYPDLWDENGTNISPYQAIRDVRWRRG